MNLTTKTYGEDINILGSAHYIVKSCTVSDTGVVVDAEGRKIVPKGSLVDADGVIANDATVVGILFKDVDVTNGSQEGSLIEHGVVLVDRLPVAPAVEAKGALPHIIFR